jgi:hypothetical protein
VGILLSLVLALCSCIPAPAHADPSAGAELAVGKDDIEIEQDIVGGYHLWIRKAPGIGSVLITESSADPARQSASFALRDPDKNPVNGEEKRILNGKPLDPSKGLYSLIDSTPETHPPLGEAFHIFIPYIVVFGYPWSREGEIQVLDGTFLNIRSFAKPFADYAGAYRDNPFVLRVTQKPLEGPPAANYMPETVRKYTDIAREGGGQALFSEGEQDLPKKIAGALDSVTGDELDLVLALDTTDSMTNDMPHLKKELVPLVREHAGRFTKFRVGLLLYRDYFDEYLNKALPFTDSLEKLQAQIDSVRVAGGRDIPEAVYEALYAGIVSYEWQARERLILLVGDAPPHPRPRGKVTPEMVFQAAKEKGIEITTIILPQ